MTRRTLLNQTATLADTGVIQYNNLGTLGATYTLTVSSGIVLGVLTASTVITLPSPTAGGQFLLVLKQDTTGGRIPSFSGVTVNYPAGNPNWVTAANAVNVLEFRAWDTGAWYAFPATSSVDDITGNAATATKLLTARNINGVAFDGTADVTVVDSTKATQLSIVSKTANYTLAANEFVKADATSGVLVMTLPTAPLDKTRAGVKKVDSSVNAVTINAGGSDKFNTSTGPTSASVAYTNQAFVLQYNASDSTWVVTSTDFPKSQMDLLYLAIGGIAAAATKLATARSVNGVPFDGTADITISAGTTLTPTAVKTTTYAAAASDLVPADTSSGGFTITVPTAPADKSQIVIKKIDSSTNAVTVAAGGSDRFNTSGGPSSFGMALQNQAVHLQYMSSSGIWYVISIDVPLSGLDARYTPLNTLTTKGDLYVASAANNPIRVGVGSDGAVLTASAAAASGVAWASSSMATAVNNGDGTGTFSGSATNNGDGTGTLS